MIEYIFALFVLYGNLSNYSSDVPDNGEKAFCAEVQLASSFVSTEEMYAAAFKKFNDNESKLELFYAFWENRDTCISKPRKD